jgi:excisionase family DNA binding protein
MAAAPTLPTLSAPPAPAASFDPRATMLAGLLSGWQTIDEAAAELRVTAAYLWELVQAGYLRAWALPGTGASSMAGVRVRRDDLLALLQPVVPAAPAVPTTP